MTVLTGQERRAQTAVANHFHRVLLVATSLPFPPTNGYKMRVSAILKGLCAEGCQVDLVSFGDNDQLDCSHRDELLRFCNSVTLIAHQGVSLSGTSNVRERLVSVFSMRPHAVVTSQSPRMRLTIEMLLRQFKYDAVVVEETNLIENLPQDLAVPLIVDHHNAEHILLRRYVQYAESPVRALYARLEAGKTKRWERYATRRASAVLVCSDEDRRIYRNLDPGTPAFVVPNVIDTDHYIPSACADQNNHTVLYTGGMDWHPNRDAVRYFVGEILPELRRRVPDVKFVVAGRNPSPDFVREFWSIPGIRFTGTLADMRPEVANAAVCVVPLRIGSGTRLKILEAAAMAKAIVSTGTGAEGLDFVNNEEIILADEPFRFADAVDTLLTDNNRRKRLGNAARKRVEAMYGFPAVRAAVKDLRTSIAKRPEQR